MSDPDDTDHLDPEDQVTDNEQEPPPVNRYKRGDPIPQIPLEQLLAFENEHPGQGKEGLISRTFGIRPIHYYMQLNTAIDNPEAVELDPILVGRLKDTRTARLAARASRTLTRPTR